MQIVFNMPYSNKFLYISSTIGIVKYSIIIFDLDGTITNPVEGIVNSIRYALNRLGENELEVKNLHKFIGPPLHHSFQKYCGFNETKSMQAVELYREYFSKKGMFENKVYPGVIELLNYLKEIEVQLFIGTSKPAIFANQILDHFQLSKYFKNIYGSDLSMRKSSKSDIILQIIQENNITDRKKVLMIGDTIFDIKGAQECHIDSLAVLYGYGDPIEINIANPTYHVNSLDEVLLLIE